MGEEGGETVVGMLNKYIFFKKRKKKTKILGTRFTTVFLNNSRSNCMPTKLVRINNIPKIYALKSQGINALFSFWF